MKLNNLKDVCSNFVGMLTDTKTEPFLRMYQFDVYFCYSRRVQQDLLKHKSRPRIVSFIV